MARCVQFAALLVLLVPFHLRADQPPVAGEAPGVSHGWRGNWTGRYPRADPPLAWGREPQSAVEAVRCALAAGGEAKDAQPIHRGLIRQWLLLGPIAAADASRNIDKGHLPNEADLAGADGAPAEGKAWKRHVIEIKPDYDE